MLTVTGMSLVLWALVACSLEQEPPLRVLFVGNSFTFGNELPRLVAELGLVLRCDWRWRRQRATV